MLYLLVETNLHILAFGTEKYLRKKANNYSQIVVVISIFKYLLDKYGWIVDKILMTPEVINYDEPWYIRYIGWFHRDNHIFDKSRMD